MVHKINQTGVYYIADIIKDLRLYYIGGHHAQPMLFKYNNLSFQNSKISYFAVLHCFAVKTVSQNSVVIEL